jgi:hypothetical protein
MKLSSVARGLEVSAGRNGFKSGLVFSLTATGADKTTIRQSSVLITTLRDKLNIDIPVVPKVGVIIVK